MSTVRNRPVSISHLVFGLIFLGLAAIWVIGAATDADAPDLALLAPAVLIGAGAVGLVGIVVNARNARVHAPRQIDERHFDDRQVDETDQTHEPQNADTSVLEQEEQS